MQRNTLFIAIGVLLLILIGWQFLGKNTDTKSPSTQSSNSTHTVPSAEPSPSPSPNDVTVNITLASRKLSPNEVSVKEGNVLTLNVSPDEGGEFHITGYEIEKEIRAGATTEIKFTADKPGRYNFELHPQGKHDDIVIGALVVNPR